MYGVPFLVHTLAAAQREEIFIAYMAFLTFTAVLCPGSLANYRSAVRTYHRSWGVTDDPCDLRTLPRLAWVTQHNTRAMAHGSGLHTGKTKSDPTSVGSG